MTAVTLAPAPVGHPIVDLRTGYLSRPWAQWFAQGIDVRVGGPTAMSNDDLEASINAATLDASAADRADSLERRIASLEAAPTPEVFVPAAATEAIQPDLGGEVDVLRRAMEAVTTAQGELLAALDDLRRRLDAIEGLPVAIETEDLARRVEALEGGAIL